MYRCGIETKSFIAWEKSVRCINCTVVELKHQADSTSINLNNVLIVPLWNWNYLFDIFSHDSSFSINCTVVELKLWKLKRVNRMRARINCTVVELKRFRRHRIPRPWRCINCTVVELKRISFMLTIFSLSVLIVPLWNWNVQAAEYW